MIDIKSLLNMICTEAIEEYSRDRIASLEPLKIGPELPPILYDEPILNEEDRAYFEKKDTKS